MKSFTTTLVALLPFLCTALAAPAEVDARQVGTPTHPIKCNKGYTVRAGDSCWSIANNNGMSLDQFLNKNPGLQCKNLQIAVTVCI